MRTAAALLLALFCGRAAQTAWQKSPTYDEPYHIAAGYTMVAANDFRMRHSKPVLSLELIGLPLLFTQATYDPNDPYWMASDGSRYKEERSSYDPMYDFGLDFVYHNKIPTQELVFLARLAPLACAALLGLLVFWAASRLFGPKAGLCALIFYTFDPNILAYAALANQDMIAAAFYFATVCALHFFLEKPTRARGAALGAALTGAILSKFTAVLLLPTLAVVCWTSKQGAPSWWRRQWRAWAPGLTAGALLFLVCYRGTHIVEFFRALTANNVIMKQGQYTFLHGIHKGGLWYYFVGAFLLKTPLPLILLCLPPFFYKKSWSEPRLTWLSVPVVMLVAAASLSNLQLGLRYVLPIYPFLCILAGKTAESIKPRAAAWCLLGWLAVGSLAVHPDYLTYFNELAGGPSNGWHWLVDSNLDWGQDLRGLSDYVRNDGASDVILSYFGFAPAEAAGFPFQDIFGLEMRGHEPHLNGPEPTKELLAVSATQLQGVYLYDAFGGNPLEWLKDRKPESVIGHSIFVWDITRDADAHLWLAHTYFISKRPAQARRELARAAALAPPRAWGLLLASFLAPTKTEGLKLFAQAARLDPTLGAPWDQITALPRARAWYVHGLARLGVPFVVK
jgi:hypothetical protein